jgi:hypothetical protein
MSLFSFDSDFNLIIERLTIFYCHVAFAEFPPNNDKAIANEIEQERRRRPSKLLAARNYWVITSQMGSKSLHHK